MSRPPYGNRSHVLTRNTLMKHTRYILRKHEDYLHILAITNIRKDKYAVNKIHFYKIKLKNVIKWNLITYTFITIICL